MDSPPLDTYLVRIAAEARPLVVAIDDAVRKAYPDFDVAIKYQMLMYALHRDWGTWVCAVGATKHSICLRFLYGVLMSDPQRVLRAGNLDSQNLGLWLQRRDRSGGSRCLRRGGRCPLRRVQSERPRDAIRR